MNHSRRAIVCDLKTNLHGSMYVISMAPASLLNKSSESSLLSLPVMLLGSPNGGLVVRGVRDDMEEGGETITGHTVTPHGPGLFMLLTLPQTTVGDAPALSSLDSGASKLGCNYKAVVQI